MNEKKVPFVALPLGTFDNGKITVMMGLVLEYKAIEDDVVNMSNYQDYLLYTLYLAKTPDIKTNEKTNKATITIDFNSVFINIIAPTEKQLNNMHSVLYSKIKELITDNPEDADDIKNIIIKTAEDYKKNAIDGFEFQAQAYLTTN